MSGSLPVLDMSSDVAAEEEEQKQREGKAGPGQNLKNRWPNSPDLGVQRQVGNHVYN